MAVGAGVEEVEPTAVDLALDAFSTAFDHLLKVVEDGGLDSCDDSGLIGVLQGFERVRNRMALVDHRMLRDAAARALPEKLAQPSVTGLLVATLRLSRGEAGRRVRAAEAVGQRVSMPGEPLRPVRPTLAAAQRSGEVTPEQVAIVVRALASVDHRGFDPADLDAGEQLLAGFAATFAPAELSRLAAQVLDRIDPDGTRPTEELNRDRRHLSLRPTRDGMYVGEMRLTGELGAKLNALLSPLAKPRVETIEGPDGRPVESRDERHAGQRLHDALEEVCNRVLHADDRPATGGTPATVIVTIDWDYLLARTGHGTASDGTLLPTDTVLRMAGEADIVPVVLTASGKVLDLGRSRRCATENQTLALVARDGGCFFPGCDRPPQWCERHHITAWVDGGPTSLDNLTLLCAYHHANFAARGWTCVMQPDGLPSWIPPRWIDRQQRPLRNPRVTGQHSARRLRR